LPGPAIVAPRAADPQPTSAPDIKHVVEARKPVKALDTPDELPDDPEGEARVKAFFKRMMQPPST
jgi:hypothetical protein